MLHEKQRITVGFNSSLSAFPFPNEQPFVPKLLFTSLKVPVRIINTVFILLVTPGLTTGDCVT